MHFVIQNNNNDEERPRVFVKVPIEQPSNMSNHNNNTSSMNRKGSNTSSHNNNNKNSNTYHRSNSGSGFPQSRQSPPADLNSIQQPLANQSVNPPHLRMRTQPAAISSLSPQLTSEGLVLVSPTAAAIAAAAAALPGTVIPDGNDVRVNGKQYGWSKQEKSYISQLETQLRLHEQRKNELLDKNNSLESLLKIQDEKIQTYLDEIKHLRVSYDTLFKENKQVHMRLEGFSIEKNALLADNSNLREEIKKAQARLALPFRPALPKKSTNLKPMQEISRENNYIDATLLANDATLARYSSAKSDSQQSLSALRMVSSNAQSPIQQQPLRQANQLKHAGSTTSQPNLQQKHTNQSKKNKTPPGTAASEIQPNLESGYRAQLEDEIDRLHEEADSHRYEIRLLNQALARSDTDPVNQLIHSNGETNSNDQGIIQNLIAQLVESQERIVQHEKASAFLQERIESFEKLIDSYTLSHKNNPREMDRASIERKNVFLIQENSTLLATINALRLEIQEQSKRIADAYASNSRGGPAATLASERGNGYDSIQSQDYNTISAPAAGIQHQQFYQSAQFHKGSESAQAGTLSASQLGVSKKKLSLGESIKSQKLAHADMLSTCCKDTHKSGKQPQRNKRNTTTSNSNLANNTSSYVNVSFDNLNDNDLRKQLQFEKNKNQLLSKMVEEEQEKHCELLVYKEEIDYYVNKNRDLTKEVISLNKQLNEIHFTRGSKPSHANTGSPKRASDLISSSIGSPRANTYNSNNAVAAGTNAPINSSMSSSTRNQQHSVQSPRLQSPLRCSSTAGVGVQSTNSQYNNNNNSSSSASVLNLNKSDRVMSVYSQKSMNSVVDLETMRCAHMQMERELQLEIEKKEQQIDNILTSRNLMQKTLGDQLSHTKADNKQLVEQNAHLTNQVTILTHETNALKTLVRRAERKNLLGTDD